MDIQSEKLNLIKWLAGINDIKTIEAVRSIKLREQRISIEQYNRELEEADAEIERGEYFTQDEVEQKAGEW